MLAKLPHRQLPSNVPRNNSLHHEVDLQEFASDLQDWISVSEGSLIDH